MNTIIYRVSPFEQHNPSPIHAKDKYKLVRLCHNSFLRAKGSEKTIYLLDSCPDWSDIFIDGEVINYTAGSRAASILSMYDVAKKYKGNILFVEDDYLWLPNTVYKIWNALEEFNIVSPYDHPDHYVRWPDFTTKKVNDTTFRSAPSNTHTFATTHDYLIKYYDTFLKHMDHDHPLFEELPDDVWQPTPSFATHMVDGLLSPGIDWESLYL